MGVISNTPSFTIGKSISARISLFSPIRRYWFSFNCSFMLSMLRDANGCPFRGKRGNFDFVGEFISVI